MKILRSYFHRLRSLFRRERLDRELNDELPAHLEMHTADNLRAGMSPEQARRAALLKLGGVEQTKGRIANAVGCRCWNLFCRICASASECCRAR
jgi:hypothetical protein